VKRLKKSQRLIGLTLLTLFTGFSTVAFAGGFQLFEENVTNLGNAYAGTGAEASDASTEFYNPAGMTLLNNPQFVVSGTWIDVDIDANVSKATSTIFTANPQLGPIINGSTAVTGANDMQPGGSAVVPSMHFVYPFDHKWALGFGINAPFGLETNYTNNSPVRYLATDSKVTTVDISPSIAYQVLPQFSLGLGVDSQYIKATFDQAIPSPTGASDGAFTNEGENWGWGWHAGALYQITCDTRVGLDYHSQVKHNITGGKALLTADLSTPPIFIFPANPLKVGVPGTFTATLTLPDYWDLSIYHAFDPQWAVLGSIDYTHWSTIQALNVNYSGALRTDAVQLATAQLPFNFRNTWRAALGLNYKPAPKWTLRTGVAYDESPVPNATSRTLRLPDSNRFWLATGVQYIINRAFTLDAGYSHLFVKDSSMNSTQQFNVITSLPIFALNNVPVSLTQNAMGNFKSSVNEVGVQLTWNMPTSYS
jgi:long-chain fatty acid transport protein